MSFFKQKKEKELNPSQEAMVSRIANAVLEKQYRFATFLNGKAKMLGRSNTITILIFFGSLIAAYCVWLIASALG